MGLGRIDHGVLGGQDRKVISVADNIPDTVICLVRRWCSVKLLIGSLLEHEQTMNKKTTKG